MPQSFLDFFKAAFNPIQGKLPIYSLTLLLQPLPLVQPWVSRTSAAMFEMYPRVEADVRNWHLQVGAHLAPPMRLGLCVMTHLREESVANVWCGSVLALEPKREDSKAVKLNIDALVAGAMRAFDSLSYQSMINRHIMLFCGGYKPSEEQKINIATRFRTELSGTETRFCFFNSGERV